MLSNSGKHLKQIPDSTLAAVFRFTGMPTFPDCLEVMEIVSGCGRLWERESISTQTKPKIVGGLNFPNIFSSFYKGPEKNKISQFLI